MKKIGSLLFIMFFFYPLTHSQVDPELLKDLNYRNIGPTRGGRATTVTGIPSQPGTFYMGATGGGVWKTTDYGQSWQNVSDGFFGTGSIGAIRVAPSDPNIVFAGTGSDGIRSNVIPGDGVYKSTDAGKTWQHIGLKYTGQIGAVEIHPTNPDIAFVAAIGMAFGKNRERGVYRTTNGGRTWDQVLFHSDSVGAADLEFAPDDPNTIYATLWRAQRKPWTIISGGMVGGIYRSRDGGITWTQLKNGLPAGLIGKIDLAVSAANPSVVWALVEAPEGEGGLYRSDNKGDQFTLVSTTGGLIDRPFYYCNVDANPRNEDHIFVNSTRFWISKNGGKAWRTARTPHGDNHDIWINPLDTLIWIQCNDGGANVTRDGGATWSSIENQPTAELYQVEVDDQFPFWLYAGQQDNSTIAVPSLPPYSAPAGASSFWMAVGGCETGPAVPKPGNHNIVYSNCKGRFGVYDKTTGQEKQYYVGATNIYSHNPRDLVYRFQRVSPIHVSPHNPDVVYHGSQFLHKTVDDGITWQTISPDLTAFTPETQVISGSPITRDITGEEYYSTIYAVRESPVQAGLIWVGANDGPVHVTRDGGKKWTNVTPSQMPAQGRIDCTEPSPHRANKAYIAGYRYLLGDFRPYIYRTNDLGASWTLLTSGSNGIPSDEPARVVREDPVVEGLLYAGTDKGIYVSFDDGGNWQPLRNNFPVVPVTDIKVVQNNLAISTMGRSFWVLDDITRLHEIAKGSLSANHLFKISDAYRLRYRPSSQVPVYSAAGVVVEYMLKEDYGSSASLEIVSADGKIVQTFEASEPRESEEDSPSMETGFFMPAGNEALQGSKGVHRFIWDMRHAGPWNSRSSMSGRGGPMVSPGKFTARLKIGEEVISSEFSIKMDPRVAKSGLTVEDLKAQEDLGLKVRDLMSDARKLSETVRKQLAELEKIETRSADQEDELKVVREIDAKLHTARGRYMTPMLVDQINYLNSMINSADQRPGKDAYDRYNELLGIFKGLKPQLDKILDDQG